MELHKGLFLEGEGAPSGSPAGGGAGAVDEQPKGDEQIEQEPTVPLAALIAERKKHQQRERELLSKIPAAGAEQPKQPAGGGDGKGLTADEEAAWDRHIAALPIGKKLMEALATVEELKAENSSLRVGAQLATEMFHDRLVTDADHQYDEKTMPVSREGWHMMVAANMTDELLGRVYAGDPKAWKEVIANARKGLGKGAAPSGPVKSQVELQKEREARKVASLGKQPGAGGTPPGEPAPERVTGPALHSRAFARFQDALARKG